MSYHGSVCLLVNRPVEVLIDANDFQRISKHRWCLSTKRHGGRAYVVRCSYPENKIVMLHREILGAKSGRLVDHINLNSLDNRKSNLRFCTASQNCQNKGRQANNTSGFKGVWKHRPGKWRAIVKANYRKYDLGLFDSPLAAFEARRNILEKVHGEFARSA